MTWHETTWMMTSEQSVGMHAQPAKRPSGGPIDAVFAAKKARAPSQEKLRLSIELHPNGYVLVTGDTAPLKDYLLKPLGFEWCHGKQTWQNKTGGRPAFERLLAKIDRAHTEVDVQDHAPPLAKCSLGQLESQSSDLDDLSESCAHPERNAPQSQPSAPPRQPPAPVAAAWTEDEMLPDDVLCAALDAATGGAPSRQWSQSTASQGSARGSDASVPTASAPTVRVVPAEEDSDALTDAAMCAALDAFERSRAATDNS